MGFIIWREILYLNMMSVILYIPSHAEGVQIRLVGSNSSRCSGRVEIYHNNSWGTVCDDYWDLNDTDVVCRELSCGRPQSAPRNAHFGQGDGPIWMDNVRCSGEETSLTECTHRGFGVHDCNHKEDAGVVCSGPWVRLVDGGRCSGRVEVYHSGQWGTVCDDYWDMNDAEVVCRELGCGTASSIKKYGKGTGKIWLVNVACSGTECSLTQCSHPGFGINKCGHSGDVGVVCSGQTSARPRLSASQSTLSPGEQLILTCSAPRCGLLNVTFYQDGSSIGHQTFLESQQTSVGELILSNVDSTHSYTCQYSTQSTITHSSSHSSPVNTIFVRLPMPSISLTSQDAGLFWASDGSEVTRGYSFSITCSIEAQYPGGIFYLTFSGSNMTDMKAAVNHFASFQFPAAEYEHQGNYNCVYEVTVSSRNFTSNSSELLNVSVSTSPIPLLVGGTIGGVLLLLLLLIGLCLMWRRSHRRPASRPEVKTDHTACEMNAYNTVGRADDDDEDDEEDYISPDVSTCDHGNDDDSDDYENVSVQDYKGASNMHKHVYNPGEDEEEENDDDDDDSDDYENGDYKEEEEEENDAIYANTGMYPASSTKEHFNPGRRVVEGQSDEDEQDNIYTNYDV